ncbi:hypothetical protein DV515_00004663, partial [Chloebia gouldiae]
RRAGGSARRPERGESRGLRGAEPGRGEPSRAEGSRAGPRGAEPGRGEPSRAEGSRAGPRGARGREGAESGSGSSGGCAVTRLRAHRAT